VIGHVERGEALLRVRGHGARRGVEIERAAIALHVGDLPEPVSARETVEAGGEA
jgi:hypothetical protein